MATFYTIQAEVAAILTGNPYFADVPVLTEDVDDIQTEVLNGLAKGCQSMDGSPSKIGLAILVLTPSMRNRGDSTKALLNIEIDVVVSIYENGTVNRGPKGIGKRSLDVLWNACWLLQNYGKHRAEPSYEFVESNYAFDQQSGISNRNAFFKSLRRITGVAS